MQLLAWRLLLRAEIVARRVTSDGIFFLYRSGTEYLEAYSPMKAGRQRAVKVIKDLDQLAAYFPSLANTISR